MTEEIKNNEFIDEKEEPSRKDRFNLKGLVDGTLLTRNFVIKQLPFFFFLFLLGLTYISNRYHAERVRKNIAGLKNELKELNMKISGLGVEFGQNLLGETNAYQLIIEDEA